MDALDYGSDSSSAADESLDGKAGAGKTSETSITLLEDYSHDSEDDQREIEDPTSKKAKIDSHVKPALADRFGLPPPPLNSDSCMAQWPVDYLTKKMQDFQPTKTIPVSDALRRLVEKQESNKSWAEHLKDQREFHNPGFFQQVVEHFGIQNELISNSTQYQEAEEWEYDFLRLPLPKRMRETRPSDHGAKES